MATRKRKPKFSEQELSKIRAAVTEKLGPALGTKVFKALAGDATRPPGD